MEWSECHEGSCPRAIGEPCLDRCIRKLLMWGMEPGNGRMASAGVGSTGETRGCGYSGRRHCLEGAIANCTGMCLVGEVMEGRESDGSL